MIADVAVHACRTLTSFNEARAVSPGKSRSMEAVFGVVRFNEARAVSPGKSWPERDETRKLEARLASMRPGPFRPGNLDGGHILDVRGVPRIASMRPGPFRPGNVSY